MIRHVKGTLVAPTLKTNVDSAQVSLRLKGMMSTRRFLEIGRLLRISPTVKTHRPLIQIYQVHCVIRLPIYLSSRESMQLTRCLAQPNTTCAVRPQLRSRRVTALGAAQWPVGLGRPPRTDKVCRSKERSSRCGVFSQYLRPRD